MNQEHSLKPLSILLADDDEDDQKIFGDAIQEAFPHVCLNTASNGNDLLSMLKQATVIPDILFLDINMPQKNGLQCLVEIRNNEYFKELPIVIYSTSSYHPNIKETFDKGADIYFMKPTSFTSLVNNLRKIFGIDWADHKIQKSFETFVF